MNSFPNGLYRVAEVVQSGWTPTAPASRDVAFTAGNDSNKVDFFNFGGGNIVGTVWEDLNQDGIRATDPTTGAFTDPDSLDGRCFLTSSLRVAEESMGSLIPANLRPSLMPPEATHSLVFRPGTMKSPKYNRQAGMFHHGYDTKQTATVVALGTATQDFANFSTMNGSIDGTIWNDVNGNGDRAIDPATGLPTEPGLGGWTVFIDANTNGLLDSTELSTTTDATGHYHFVSVLAGTYSVREVLPPKWTPAPGFSAQQSVTVIAGDKVGKVDFANFTVLNGSIRGSVWNDLNRDGVRNTTLSGSFSDPGLAGWTVYLDMNRSGAFDAGEPTTLTDATGGYVFPDLQIGDYDVIEVVPTGWETAPTFGDNYTATVFSGAETRAHDFANFNLSTLVLGSVSGIVWNDQNANGIQDTSPTPELGLGGRQVFADANSNGLLDATDPQATTNADGTYTISGVAPGTVSVFNVVPAGWRATSPLTSVRSLVLKNGRTWRASALAILSLRTRQSAGPSSQILTGTASAMRENAGWPESPCIWI